jgi:hypothetical protein
VSTKHDVGWTLVRTNPDDPEGDEIEIPICVRYTWSPGCRARLHLSNGDPGWPAEDPEVEIVSAEVDVLGGAPVELSDLEESEIRTWIVESHESRETERERWEY